MKYMKEYNGVKGIKYCFRVDIVEKVNRETSEEETYRTRMGRTIKSC